MAGDADLQAALAVQHAHDENTVHRSLARRIRKGSVMKFTKPLAVVGAAALMFMATDAVTYAATGSSLVLGRLNQANATTTIQNTGSTPALKLVTKSAATAPLVVNGKGKVTNLYADRAATADNARKLGGRTPGQIVAAATGPQYGRQIVLATAIDTVGIVGYFTSIAIGADALPIVSYFDGTNGDLKVARCANAACTTATTTAIDTAGDVGGFTSITIGADGLPIISYYDLTNGDLKVAHCNNTACTTATTTAIDTAGNVGYYTSIAVGADGLPVISYWGATDGDLKVAHCANLTCTSVSNTTAIDTVGFVGFVGYYTSITIGDDGQPVISYYDFTNADLKVARIKHTAWAPNGWGR